MVVTVIKDMQRVKEMYDQKNVKVQVFNCEVCFTAERAEGCKSLYYSLLTNERIHLLHMFLKLFNH